MVFWIVISMFEISTLKRVTTIIFLLSIFLFLLTLVSTGLVKGEKDPGRFIEDELNSDSPLGDSTEVL